MAGKINEGDLVRLSKATLFTSMMGDPDSGIYEFHKKTLKSNKTYEVLFLFEDHPERGDYSELCRKCVFREGCLYDVVILKDLEAYGWCAQVFDKVEDEGEN